MTFYRLSTAPAGGRGVRVLALSLAIMGNASMALATGFCDPGSGPNSIDDPGLSPGPTSGVHCHQIRPAALVAPPSPGPLPELELYSSTTFDAYDPNLNNVSFVVNLSSVVLPVSSGNPQQLRIFELGLGLLPLRPTSPGTVNPPITDGRALTVTVSGQGAGIKRNVRVDLLNAVGGNSPSLNYAVPASVLSSISVHLPVGATKAYFSFTGGAQWKNIGGEVRFDDAASTYFNFPVATDAIGSAMPLYAISGLIAGDIDPAAIQAGTLAIRFDYSSPDPEHFH